LEPRINFFFRLRTRQKLVGIRFGCGLDSRIYGGGDGGRSSSCSNGMICLLQ
jgi:hypothetical protein